MGRCPSCDGSGSLQLTVESIEGFWARVQRGGPDDCWLWTGGSTVGRKGTYGSLVTGNVKWIASRFSFWLANGYLTPGLYVCHTCDVGLCMNPRHLFEGDAVENNEDRRLKGGYTTLNQGDSNGRRKVTQAQVDEMRRRHKPYMRLAPMATEYGISLGHLKAILYGRFWKVTR